MTQFKLPVPANARRAVFRSPSASRRREERMTIFGTWDEFKMYQASAEATGGRRATYLDGMIELMTLSLEHESRKSHVGILLESYLLEREIEFFMHGSATLEKKKKEAAKEPDESYCFHTQKPQPDLVIEIAISRSAINTLEIYQRWAIPEVWIWHRNKLAVYLFDGENYFIANDSRWFPDLDVALLSECAAMESITQARKRFLAKVRKSS